MNRKAGLSSVARRRFHNGQPSTSGRTNTPAGKPPLTHFLSLPIGHHISLQRYVSSFTKGLLETTPTLPGLDQSIVVAPRRLHLTLGIMSLVDPEQSNSDPNNESSNSRKTLPEALSLLSSLRPLIMEMLCGNCLSVPLEVVNIMQPDGGDPDKAHVLWVGPSLETEEGQRLMKVGEMVNKAFMQAGFIIDRRPLKLHCTILNTMYRKPKSRGPRQPFSYRSLLVSPACRAFLAEPHAELDFRRPVRVNFGTWPVDEIQICKAGSYGAEGEYLCGGEHHEANMFYDSEWICRTMWGD
ncbi:kinase A anchor protein [Melanogaster broomeanus]|nr:kinase A anchor protein [Melanogaster broomeanus]